MNYKYKVSICMIVKNEEANLQRCLDSFLPIINMKDDDTLESLAELIIVDTGSTDKTVNIAKKYTDKVYEKEFEPWSFSTARNYGISFAEGERILIIDADEQLEQSSVYILMDALINPKYKENKTMFIKLHNYYDHKTNQYAEVIQPRIFYNTDEPIYQFSIHNKPNSPPPYLFLANIIFKHYGYLFERADLFLKKKERSLPMLEAEYKKNPKDLHILTHICKTYYACGDFDNCIKTGNAWIKYMRKVDFHKGWFAYLEVFANLLSAYVSKGDGRNAERVLKESKKYSTSLISLYLILGQYYLSKKKKERARELFEEAYLIYRQQPEPFEQLCSTNTEVIMPEILNYLALMTFEEGNYQKAGEYMNAGILINKNRLPLRWDIWNDIDCFKRLEHVNLRKRNT